MLWLAIISLLAASYMYNEGEAQQKHDEAH